MMRLIVSSGGKEVGDFEVVLMTGEHWPLVDGGCLFSKALKVVQQWLDSLGEVQVVAKMERT